MSENPNAIEPLSFDRLAPQDDDDRSRRALFYCHCLHLYSKRTLELLLNRVDVGEFGEALQEQVAAISDWQLESAEKLLTCINLHIAGLDHGGDESPPWLLYFLSEAATEADELFPDPPAIDIIAKHGSWKREKMLRDVAADVSNIVGFSEAKEDFEQQVQKVVQESESYRAELLLFALSQPPEALRRHLEMLAG